MKKRVYIMALPCARIFPFLRSRHMRIIDGPNKGKKWLIGVKDNSCILGCYEQQTFESISKYIRPGQVIYDIGSNAGYFTLAFSDLTGNSGKVFAFEPWPGNIFYLKKHISLNQVKNIFVHEVCISDREGAVHFSDSSNHMANTYIEESPVFNASKKITVKAASLDYLVSSGKTAPPQFVKIDAEGAELDVLSGGEKTISSFHPVFFLATHNNHNPGVKERCIDFLKKRNYSLYSVAKNKTGDMEDFIATPG